MKIGPGWAWMTLLTAILFSALAYGEDIQLKPYAGLDEWAADKDQRMSWWREARFGLFVHWGLYSGAGGYWNDEKYLQHYAEWIQCWASVPPREYSETLKPKFTAAKYDPSQWAQLAKDAGMKYAIMTAKHHEGFTLFNSKHPYSLNNPVTGGTNISPQGRDLAGEFARAFRDKGLKVGFYYSLVDWQHPHAYEFVLPGYPKDDTPRQYEQYVDYLHQHTRELITGYGPIDIFWCDFSSKRFEGSKTDPP